MAKGDHGWALCSKHTANPHDLRAGAEQVRSTIWLFCGFESGVIIRPWRSKENIGLCDYAMAFSTQRTTLRIIPIRVVDASTWKREHVDLERLV
jgi:hypothetical protein